MKMLMIFFISLMMIVTACKETMDISVSELQQKWGEELLEQHKTALSFDAWITTPNKYLMKKMSLSCQFAFIDLYAELNNAMKCEKDEDCVPLQIWYPLSCGKTINRKYAEAIGHSILAEYVRKCYDWKSDEEKCAAAKDYKNICDIEKKVCVLGESIWQ